MYLSGFSKEEHRMFNRNADAFDKGETFSGVVFSLGFQLTRIPNYLDDNLGFFGLKN